MKNKTRLAVLVIIGSSMVFYACQKEGVSQQSGKLDQPHGVSVYFTDHQTPVFDSVFVDLQKLEVKVSDDSGSNGGWVNLNITPRVVNILRFRNGLDTLFATGTLPNARLQKIRLTLGSRNSVMKNGQTFPLTVKSEDRVVEANLGSNNFEISANNQVLFWIDFDAGNSIQLDNSGPGNNNGYRLKASLKLFTRSQSGRIEGTILPRVADAIVKAVNGTDTATAIPDDDNGEFKIVGLNAGTYKLLVDGQNGYQDTIINNIVVRNNEDTHVPVITLHQ